MALSTHITPSGEPSTRRTPWLISNEARLLGFVLPSIHAAQPFFSSDPYPTFAVTLVLTALAQTTTKSRNTEVGDTALDPAPSLVRPAQESLRAPRGGRRSAWRRMGRSPTKSQNQPCVNGLLSPVDRHHLHFNMLSADCAGSQAE